MELNDIFSKNQVLSFLKINQKCKITPKLIKKSGILVALSMTLLVNGCTNQVFSNNNNEISVEETNLHEKDFFIVENMLKKQGYDFHILYNYDKEKLYRIHIDFSKLDEKSIECQNFEEFYKYIDTEINPTYDDVKNTINKNNNLSDKYKKWLIEGIDNLEKYMPKVNLTVLNFNMNRLKIKEMTTKELNERTNNKRLAGVFDSETGEAYIVNDKDEKNNKFIFYHEIFGHGISEASFKRNVNEDNESNIKKEKIKISTSFLAMKILNENKVNGNSQFLYIGEGFGEGLADQIAKYSLDDDKIKGHPYIETSEQLRIMCETVGLSLEEYISNGGAEILSKKMQEVGITNSLMYIVSNDVYVSAMKSEAINLISKDDTFEANILSFFKDYYKSKIAKGEDKEEIVKKLSKILFKGGDFIHSTFNDEKIDYSKLNDEFEEDVGIMDEEH